jgi:hypothetical protein
MFAEEVKSLGSRKALAALVMVLYAHRFGEAEVQHTVL